MLKEDKPKVLNLNFSEIRELVAYYNISKNSEDEKDKKRFSVTFDKDKIHDLFYKRGISYSDVNDKEFYILPIELNENEIFVFSNNYFYKNWIKDSEEKLIEFILPLENIEIIQNVNSSKNDLLDLDLNILFKGYLNKNIALVLIDKNYKGDKKVYIKTRIQDKIISKNINFKKRYKRKRVQ